MRKVRVLATTLTLVFAGVFAGTVLATPQARHSRRGHGDVVRPRTSGDATRTSHPVVAFTQEFQSNTNGFCQHASGVAPCNGAEGNYGTIDRVHSRFSNGGSGNYAPFTKALVGQWMALTSGTQAINEGGGCPSTATEYCSGPFGFFGTGTAMGHENVFPTGGFTVTDDLYLSPTTATTGEQVDDDVGINNHAGAYGQDEVISACPGAGGYTIGFGNSSPGTCTTGTLISTDGWYRFVFIFSDRGGDAYVNEKVLEEPNAAPVATSGPQPVGGTAEPISKWGGPGYFWLPTEDVSGVPLANFALQLGTVSDGHNP